jgi:general secretion pathway protein L
MRVLNSLRNALDWFVDGLTQAISDIEDRLRRRTPLRLIDVGSGNYAVEQSQGVRAPGLARIDQTGPAPRLLPPALAETAENRDIDVVLPADELLVRTLDPLPPESKQYLDGIVRHQLERLVPWRADNVLHTYRAVPAGNGDNRLIVTVAATAKSLHAPLFTALAGLAPRRVRLLYPTAHGGEVAIPLVGIGGAGNAHSGRLRYGVMAGLAALLLIAVGGFTYIYIASDRADAAAEENDRAIADLRKRVVARGPQAIGEGAVILAQKKALPPAVLALDKLAEALPDDTWLSELQFAEGQLRVSGTSQNVNGLVPQIEAAGIFAEPTFFSPTTRLQDGSGDRFHLQMRLKPEAKK